MGAWGTQPWENDGAADWFGDLFETTRLAEHVEKTLQTDDVEGYHEEVRAAAYLLATLGRVYIWPVDDLRRHLMLALEKLEAIRELEEYEDDPALGAEIAALRERLQELA